MKSFVTVAVVAVVAVVLMEANMSLAQGKSRCLSALTPPLNTTEVKCDKGGLITLRLACNLACSTCYRREDLQRQVGCLVKFKCTCLAKPGTETSTTTEGSPGETTPEEGSSSSNPELPTSTDLPEVPSTSPSGNTTPEQGEVTTPGQDVTTPEQGEVTTPNGEIPPVSQPAEPL